MDDALRDTLTKARLVIEAIGTPRQKTPAFEAMRAEALREIRAALEPPREPIRRLHSAP